MTVCLVACGEPVSDLADNALGLGAAGARDRRAALTLLNAAAVRERAGEVLAAGYFAGERSRGDYAGTVGRGLNE